MVNEQYRMLGVNVDERDEEKEKEKSIQTANTCDISDNVEYGDKKTGMEMSISTKTEIVIQSVSK